MRDALVWSGEVEITDILFERAAQMALTQDQDVVQTLSSQVAELMYANGFEMVRLSYESSGPDSCGRLASDDKVSDRDLAVAVANLARAGFSPGRLDAYILAGLPGQTISEITRSVAAVQSLGLRVRLCQYSPIPGTGLFRSVCRYYGVDPDEPLLHNNSIIPALDKSVDYDTFQRFKSEISEYNSRVSS